MPKKLLKLVKDIPALEVGPTPAGLGPDGTALWNTVQSEYRIDDCGGRALLAQACHAADMVSRLRSQVDSDGLMLKMQSGWRAHPALRDELGFRSFIVSTLKKLGVTDEPVRQHGRPYKSYDGVA